MKILQIIPFFAPAWGFGGPVKVCSQISEGLTSEGHRVTVLTTDAANDGKRISKLSENINGVEVRRFKNIFPKLTSGFNIFTPIGFKKYASKSIPDTDIVHCHSFFTYQNIVTSKVCVKNNIPFVLHLHESPVPLPLLGKKLIKDLFNLFFGKQILRAATKIVVVSDREKILLAQYLPEIQEKIIVIPNAIDETKIKISSKPHGNKKIILCLSRLSSIKGLDRLILAFKEVLKNDDSYELILAGPDENGTLAQLTKLCNRLNISQFVKFTGLVEGKDKETLFDQADIFALFSSYESFSLATLEAIQHGLPCCLSKEVGIADKVVDNLCGIIVQDATDPVESAKKIIRTYENKAEFSGNFSTFLHNFSTAKVNNMILNVYREILL